MTLRKFLQIVVVAAASSVATCGLAAVDQEFAPATPNFSAVVGAGNLADWAQTFTVGISGTLTGLDLRIGRQPTTQQPLLYDLRTTSGNAPTESDAGASVLVSGQLQASEVPTDFELSAPPNAFVHIDLSGAALQVSAGDVLAIVLRSDNPGTAYRWFGVGGPPSIPRYSGGDSYHRHLAGWNKLAENGDNAFRTYVSAVPEPSCSVLVLMGSAMIGVSRSTPFRPARRQRV